MGYYFIGGIFWQEQKGLGISYDTNIGTISTVSPSQNEYLFSGALWDMNNMAKNIGGKMQDNFGSSDLSEIKLMPDKFSFTKIYKQRHSPIYYSFTKDNDNNIWLGQWTGPGVGSGVAKCLVSELPLEFFLPAEMKQPISF